MNEQKYFQENFGEDNIADAHIKYLTDAEHIIYAGWIKKPESDFLEFVKEARDQFVMKINKREWNTELRTISEDILLAYDQMAAKLNEG